jgi:hypothetical protein
MVEERLRRRVAAGGVIDDRSAPWAFRSFAVFTPAARDTG